MKKVLREFKVYSFDELNDEVKGNVICEYIDFLVQTTDFDSISKNSNLYKAYKKANEMQTPWFLGSYIWDFCEDKIMKDIKQCDYLESGEVFYIGENDKIVR